MQLFFPIEFVVDGTPVSSQSGTPRSRNKWKARVKAASSAVLPDDHWVSEDRIAATLFYFSDAPISLDVDNIVKLVLDALRHHIYYDDRQVDRVVVQKFEPENVFNFGSPSATLADALTRPKPVLYVRLSNDPFEELI
ncbi:MAG: RusA family crossover junction endodeoxyribonuclease [Alphaproteobacteria bacterium]|nr:RusA family crossover junction endodeoxyribonuclease [Alphaproteobacteria bacterium]